MNITISRTALLAALKRSTRIADARSTMPILGCVVIRPAGKAITVTATDLNVSAVSTVPVTLKGKDQGAGFAVDARAFAALIDRLPGDEVAIATGTGNVRAIDVTAGKVKARVSTLDPKDAPKVQGIPDDATWVQVEADSLRAMLARCLFSVCTDATRFHLAGVLFERTGTTGRMVTTDGHRLSLVERPLALPPGPPVIIPAHGADALKGLLTGATVDLIVHDRHLFAAVEGVVLAVKLIDATFPPYAQVIPTTHKTRAVLDRAALLDAIGRSSLMASDTTGVGLTFGEDGLTVACSHPERGDVTEQVDAEVSGPPVKVGANPGYVRDLLAAMDADQVSVDLGGELAPFVFRPLAGDDATFVVMPMRI